MQKSYYKQYYDYERNHWWFLARAEILKAYISSNVFKKGEILDAGTGTGANTLWLSEFGNVKSLEFDKDCITYSREKNNIDYIEGSVLDLPFEKDKFDLVCCFDVIEHVENDAKAIQELIRVLKPNGRLIITVPAFMHLWSEHDEINHHYRRYTRRGLENLFKESHGEVKFISYFNFRLYPIVFLLRIFSRFKNIFIQRNKNISDFEKFKPGKLNDFLKWIFGNEKHVLKDKKRYPFGVSLTLDFQKHEFNQ